MAKMVNLVETKQSWFLFVIFISSDYTVYIGQYNMGWPKHRQYLDQYTGCPITIAPPYLDYIGTYPMGKVFKVFWWYEIQLFWASLEVLLTLGLFFMAIFVWELSNLFKVKKALTRTDENFQVWPSPKYHKHSGKIKSFITL